ncbi:MAG: flagellar biosynthesis protein FlhB [bacterium]
MAGDNQEEKTEQATPKKRSEARREGRVARSQELVSTFVIAAGLIALNSRGPGMVEGLEALSRNYWGGLARAALTPATVQALLASLLLQVAAIVLPLAGIIALAGVAGNMAQTGFLFAPSALAPKWKRLDPFAGVQRVFAMRGFVEALKAFLKVIVVCGVAAVCIQSEMPRITSFLWGGVTDIASQIWGIGYSLSLKIVALLLVLSAGDYAWQRWQHERDLRMSRQEVREEHRQQEGDPMIKSRIRSLQRERARRRMMSDVPTADVIVTNPTHFAVALKYEQNSMSAPKVVAKGMNRLAQRIKAIGAEHGVPVIESPELARAIYKSVKLGGVIPVALYRAVAEILALAYRLKGRIA